MRFLQSILLASVLFLPAATARAEVFYWQDAVLKASMSARGTWRSGTNQKPDDILTIWGPGQENFASCRLRAPEDRRFVIYPQYLQDEVARLNFSRAFWESYVGEFPSATLNSVTDNGGLGRGDGSWAD